MEVLKLADAPTCPVCRHVLDGAATVDPKAKRKPEAGDVSLCVHCLSVLRFERDDEHLTLHVVTDEQWLELPATTRNELKAAVELLREHRKARQV